MCRSSTPGIWLKMYPIKETNWILCHDTRIYHSNVDNALFVHYSRCLWVRHYIILFFNYFPKSQDISRWIFDVYFSSGKVVDIMLFLPNFSYYYSKHCECFGECIFFSFFFLQMSSVKSKFCRVAVSKLFPFPFSLHKLLLFILTTL